MHLLIVIFVSKRGSFIQREYWVKKKTLNSHWNSRWCLTCKYETAWRSTNHDDVTKWKHFLCCWPLWGESTGHRWIPPQRPVARSCDVFFDLRLNKRLSKQSRRQWFETPSHSLWRHCNVLLYSQYKKTIVTHYDLIEVHESNERFWYILRRNTFLTIWDCLSQPASNVSQVTHFSLVTWYIFVNVVTDKGLSPV